MIGAAEGGQHQHRGGDAGLAQAGHGAQPVEARQHAIHDDDIDFRLAGAAQAVLGRRGDLHGDLFALEDLGDRGGDELVVLNQENVQTASAPETCHWAELTAPRARRQ